MKKKITLSFLSLAILMAGLWAAVVQQQPAPQNESLAAWMPAGAILYLDSADFAAQLRDWNRSSTKAEWLRSKNYEAFATTRLFLKLQDVYAEYSAAAGFSPNLTELETVAGTDTALALYDIRQLHFLYISRLPSAQLAQNVLTRVRSGYQARGAGPQSYFIRQAGDRAAAFAIRGDYVLISSREDLLATALELMQGGGSARPVTQESWYEDSTKALPAAGPGLVSVRLAMNFADAIRTPYFRSYWIQKNTADLAGFAAFASQIRRNADSLEEDRVLIRSGEMPRVTHEAATSELQRYIPEGAGLFRLWDTPSVEFAIDLIQQKFFGAGEPVPASRRFAPGMLSSEPAGSEGDLQTRIDEAPKPTLSTSLDLGALKSLVESAGLEAVLHLESSIPGDQTTYVQSDAALALRAGSPWNAAAVRNALTSATASYQSVSNIGLQWRDAGSGAYTLSQLDGLLPLTLYVDGQNLWIARTTLLITTALQQASAVRPPRLPGVYWARYNHRLELTPYLKIMRMLDLSDPSRFSGFFSENVGSLALSLDAIESVSVRTDEEALIRRETVRYVLAR